MNHSAVIGVGIVISTGVLLYGAHLRTQTAEGKLAEALVQVKTLQAQIEVLEAPINLDKEGCHYDFVIAHGQLREHSLCLRAEQPPEAPPEPSPTLPWIKPMHRTQF